MNANSHGTIEDLKRGLLKLAVDAPPDFTGAAIVLYDSKTFSEHCHCDLRGSTKLWGGEVPVATLQNGFVTLLRSIAVQKHSCHDGFVLINEHGEVTHVAQYFVPPIVHGLAPHFDHGTRYFSAICGSMLPGVLATGVVCINRDLFLMQSGQVVFKRIGSTHDLCRPSGEDRLHQILSHGG